MEEKSIKNFDRNIEQAMNEYSVPPPFGMWNRISAELDAAAPAGGPVAAPQGSLIPRSALVGFFSGALVIGTVITGWLVYEGKLNTNAVNAVGNNNAAPAVTIPVQNTAQLNSGITNAENTIAEEKKTEQPASWVATTIKEKPVQALNGEVGTITQPVAANNSKTEEPFYFPPVDINVPETTAGTEMPKATPHVIAAATTDKPEIAAKDADDKPRISSSSTQRFKFKKPKRPKFRYGHLNRIK